MMPYAFSAMTMKSVGKAANDMVAECMRQFPKIISGEIKPQYGRCIAISTEASLREMIAPGLLVLLSPLVAGICFGKNSQAHKNAVTGDTVGDPLKDTSGPSLNILVKLSAIMSLVFGGVIADFSNAQGGPFWMTPK
jgi:inorganic pyrophosphatase